MREDGSNRLSRVQISDVSSINVRAQARDYISDFLETRTSIHIAAIYH
jgi:hypothetical protein